MFGLDVTRGDVGRKGKVLGSLCVLVKHRCLTQGEGPWSSRSVDLTSGSRGSIPSVSGQAHVSHCL